MVPTSSLISFVIISPFTPPDNATAIKGRLSSSDPVVFAVHALAEARFGRFNADLVATQQSFNKYGMALRGMSTKLEEFKYTESGFQALTEDDWQHLSFFCIVMACWEVCPSNCPQHDSVDVLT